MLRKRRKLRIFLLLTTYNLVVLTLLFVIYFPGRKAGIAFTLATGIGITNLQARVDALEQKAIEDAEFTEADKRFLRNLYTCFAKGARLTIILRQSSALMRHYLASSGEDLYTAPRIFKKSRPVQEKMEAMKRQIRYDLAAGDLREKYESEEFYMGDWEFPDSLAGLYFGYLFVEPTVEDDGTILLKWRAEVPWDWPTYESLYKDRGRFHVQIFYLPNARSLLFGSEYHLAVDDGLGGHLPELGLAKPFLVWSRWEEEMEGPSQR